MKVIIAGSRNITDYNVVKEAMDSYNRAIKINPSYAEAFNNRGNVFKEQGHLEQAIDSYEKAVLHKSDYAEAHGNHGIALKQLGRLKEALESYNKASQTKGRNYKKDSNDFFLIGYHSLCAINLYRLLLLSPP